MPTFKTGLDVSLFVSLDEVGRDEAKLFRLSYPRADQNYAWKIYQSLELLGVEAVCLEPIIGKGFRNIVLAGIYRGELIAAKIRRVDYVVKSTEREAAIHKMANEAGVGPRLISHHGPVILMELIEGVDLTSWLLRLTSSEVEEARDLISDLLRQCFMLDRAGINHDELSDASKHVLKTGRGAVILDFGSAKLTSRPSNLTSIINYLFHGPVSSVVGDILGLSKPSIEELRRYKSYISFERFAEIYQSVMGKRIVS